MNSRKCILVLNPNKKDTPPSKNTQNKLPNQKNTQKNSLPCLLRSKAFKDDYILME